MFFGQSRVPDGMRIYAIGDVHGFDDQLRRLLAGIDRELADDPPDRHLIITLGDYCDRGPDTAAVLDMLIDRQADKADLICLMGNHDKLMLDMLTEPHQAATSWLTWGGLHTLAAYGIVGRGLQRDVDALSRRFAAALPDAHRRFLQSLPLRHMEADYCFVHAGVMPGIALEDQAPEHLIWIREPFLEHGGSFGKVIVHGHTIHPRPTILPNRIAIDTGVYVNGFLTCAVLETETCRFIRAHEGGIAHSAP